MKLVFAFILLIIIAVSSISRSGRANQDTEWREVCKSGGISRWYVNPKYITKGLYANPNPNGQLLANIWVRVVPRLDTDEGKRDYQQLLDKINKHSKRKITGYAYQMVNNSFRCVSRLHHVRSTILYDADGKLLYEEKPTSLADIIHEDDVVPDTVADCIMDIACKEIAQREKQP